MNSEENTLTFEVEDVDAGVRSDKFLSVVCDGLSRARLQALISDGQVLLNNKLLKTASRKTEEGDVYMVCIPPVVEAEPKPENLPLDIVYEDDDVLVINKAAGMVVHPGAGNWDGTLVNALLYHCAGRLSGIGGVARPGIVHRLDKDTSGLMMVAKNDHAHQHLSAQLSERTLSRIYHALVLGVPMPIKSVVDRAIGRHRHNRLKMSVMTNTPRDARTHYRVLDKFGDSFSLVECKLETGRTHQIRVHMEAIGHSLVGDKLYGPQLTQLKSKIKNASYNDELSREILNYPRQFLHAKSIAFIHPVSEEEMVFDSEMPDDMVNVLNNMRK